MNTPRTLAGFNPCCSGSGSGRHKWCSLSDPGGVSILVVLEVVPEVCYFLIVN